MAEIIDCPGCKRKLQVPADVIGQRVQCPTCAVTFVAQAGSAIPAPGSPPPSSAPPPPAPRMDDDADFDRSSRSRRRRFDDDDDYYDDDRDDSRRSRRDMAPHRGDMVLVLGILALLVCAPILGPMAWVMGNNDLAEMDAGRMDPTGRSNTSVGRVLGIVATCMIVAGIAMFCLFFGMVAMIGAAAR